MVLLELLRGSIGSITAANIDLIIGENSAVVTDSSETKHEEDGHRIERTESRVRRESTAHAEQELSEDAAKLRFKKAHQFCKAVAPRRIKDFSHYKDGSGDYKWQMDNDGNQVWRLRKVGDPDNINIRTRHAPNPASEVQSTGTRPYHFACPIMESHWQLADFGIGVGLYYTMLAVWMGFLGLLFLINIPAMMCNAEFKKTMNVYKGCRNMTLNNAAGNTFSQYTKIMNGSAIDVALCATSLGMVDNPIAGVQRSADAIPSFCLFKFPTNLTHWDEWIFNTDYNGVVELNGFAMYDYGGSMAPVTVLQGASEVVCMIIMIALIGISRRFEKMVENKFDEKLQSAQDYSIRVSGILPRKPEAYKTFFNNMLKEHHEMYNPTDPSTETKSKVGVVRVTVLYDMDDMLSSLQSKIMTNRAFTASHLHYTVRNKETTLSKEEQKIGYLKGGKDGKPTCNTWFKTMLGQTKFGYYQKIHNMNNANQRLDKSIQALKSVSGTEGNYVAVRDENTECQEEDPEMNMYRLPIFAFVTFNTEAQQLCIKNVFEKREKGLWQKVVKGAFCGKPSYALQMYREHVAMIGNAYEYLVHPLPENTPDDIKAATEELHKNLLDEAVVVEAPEPSDINWMTQGYLVGKMPLGDPDLSWAPRPGSKNKYYVKQCANIKSYAIAMTILIVLFGILLAIETQAASFRAKFNNAYLDQAVGWVLAGTVTLINLALPIIMKKTVFAAEISCSETERQTSLVVKLSLVRICNSVLLIFLVSAYKDMLSLTLVSKISSLLVLDVVLSPMLRMLDIYNLIMRYCVAKKAATQASMNVHFNGTYWNLAERYTDVTKTFFLCFFYSAICPSGYALAFCAIFVNYFVDKYLLLRRWRVPPNFDATMSNANRYFQYLAILSHAAIAMYFYRNWPFECSTIGDLVERAKCEETQGNVIILKGFAKKLDSTFQSENNHIFYICLLGLMIVCTLMVFYYFCIKVCVKSCDKCFHCLSKKVTVDLLVEDETVSEKHFLDIEIPDWYFPRLPACVEANSPALLSDYMVKYQQLKQKEEIKKHNSSSAKWRWPGQQSYPSESCHSLGTNCFNSSLMIEHEIFAFAEIDITEQAPSISRGPPVGPSVGIGYQQPNMIGNPSHNGNGGFPQGPTVGIQQRQFNNGNNVGVMANAFR